MHKLGSVTGFIFNKLFLLGLLVTVIVLVPILTTSSTVTDKDVVKTWLSDSDVYNTIPDNIIDIVEVDTASISQNNPPSDGNVQKQTFREILNENGLIDPNQLVSTFKKSLDAEFLKGQVEGLIDSVYGYLDGSHSELTYSLSLSSRSDIIAKEFKSFITASLEKIPTCKPGQITNRDDFDILQTDCLPAEANISQEINKFIDEMTASDGVLGQVYTQDDIDISGADLQVSKVAYSALSQLNLILWTLFIGLSVTVVMTGSNIHRGLKTIGVVHTFFGVIYLFGFTVLAHSFNILDKVISSVGTTNASSETAIRNIGDPLVSNLINQISSRATVISIVILLIGIASIILGIVVGKHHVEHLEFHHNVDDLEEKADLSHLEIEKKPREDSEKSVPKEATKPSKDTDIIKKSKKPKLPKKHLIQ